ncbi:MAG: hypothetical protein Tsb0014_46430 [Pleurocapsa sp.]
MLTNIYLLINGQDKASGLAIRSEELLGQAVVFLEVFLEIIAILIIVVAVLIALQRLLKRISRARYSQTWEFIRLQFGLALALSLEFLLAADIVATAVSPSWDAIGKLGAITSIRTFLNFFLQKEVQELELKTQQTRKKLAQEQNIELLHQSDGGRIVARK